MIKLLLFTLLLNSSLNAKVRRFDVTKSKIFSYSFKEACKTQGLESLLVSATNSHHLDCTGQKLEGPQFCETQFKTKNLPLLRAILDIKTKKIYCQGGTEAVLSLYCTGKYKSFCYDKKRGCQALKKVFSRNLELSFSGIVEGDKKSLNCYFSNAKSLDQL